MPRRMDVKNKKVKLCSSYAPHGMDDIFNLFNLISAHGHVGQWLKIKIIKNKHPSTSMDERS